MSNALFFLTLLLVGSGLMSNALFFLTLLLVGSGLYLYSSRKWKKHENEFNTFADKMQREFKEQTPALNKNIDYYKSVEAFYAQQGYVLSKHPDFSTDFIAKKDKEIIFIRVQTPQNKESITARILQEFVGQTVLYTMDNPLYENYRLTWHYVCSKMMCDQSARIYIEKYKKRLKFELIETA